MIRVTATTIPLQKAFSHAGGGMYPCRGFASRKKM